MRRYDINHLNAQQRAIINQRDAEDRLFKEEARKRKVQSEEAAQKKEKAAQHGVEKKLSENGKDDQI